MRKTYPTQQNRRLKVKTIKKDKFSEFQKLILPLLVISLLYAFVAGNLMA